VGGCDWIVEATGKVAVLETVLRESATGASLLLLGLPYGDQRLSFEQVVAYDKTVVGSVGSSGADFREALATLPRLDTGPFLTATYPLAEFERAWAHARSGSALKVMLEVAPRVQAEAGAPH
jgi:threonine dehydrogenase-like Zn-dependent dehydrogenase